jgi:hypothetical protein
VAADFLETSTVVKRYAQEIGTLWVRALAAPAARHLLTVVNHDTAKNQDRGRRRLQRFVRHVSGASPE